MVGSFWWTVLLKLLPLYKNHSICQAGKGDTTIFWSDNWAGQPLQTKYPDLFSLFINKEMTMRSIMNQDDFSIQFQRPLSQQAFQQFNMVQDMITNREKSGNNDI